MIILLSDGGKMQFINRQEAGRLLAQKLHMYKDGHVIVYALPRGGVIIGAQIAKSLHAPLDVIIIRKIRHPFNKEYAVAAISEHCHTVGSLRELLAVNPTLLQEELHREQRMLEAKKKLYLGNRHPRTSHNKIAIIVDDGVATGLTMETAIKEVKRSLPGKMVIAVPVIPRQTAQRFEREEVEIVALEIPSDDAYKGAVGAYYEDFSQISDDEVIRLLSQNKKLKAIYPPNSHMHNL